MKGEEEGLRGDKANDKGEQQLHSAENKPSLHFWCPVCKVVREAWLLLASGCLLALLEGGEAKKPRSQ